uniref:Heterogeneous nuclear ribonucleoprotein K n=1 Tax=Mesocestoides corti TaxID=53468 RepID=A0A5K3F9Q5_MESCO
MKRDNGFPDEGPAPKFRRSDDPSKLLRVLIPSRAAGPIIGKGGETIKNLRAQYSVRLHIPDSKGPERVFNMEGDRQNICGCLKELTEVFMDVLTAKNADPRLLEGRKDDDGNDLDPEKLVDLRILIHHSQVGSVIGKSGDKIKELREKHHMQIIKIYQEFAPRSTDRVLQLIGEPDNVYACVENIMETLESAPPRGYRNDYDANNFEPEPMAMYDRYMPPPPPYGYDGPYVGGPPPPPPYGMYDDRSYYDRGYSRRGPPSSGYRR